MGGNQSSTVTDTISEYNQNVNNVSESITNQSRADCTVVNNNNITNYGTTYCNWDVEIMSRNNCNLSASSSSTTDNQLTTQLQAALSATAASNNAATTDFLQTTFTNQNQSTSIQSAISNIINNNITTTDLTTCVAQATLQQNGNFANYGTIYCSGTGSISYGADAQQNLVANCLTNSVVSAVTNDTALANAITNATASGTSTGKGLGDVIDSLLSTYETVIIAAVVISAIVCVGVLIFMGYILLSPAGQQSINTVSQAAASVATAKAGGAMLAFRSSPSRSYTSCNSKP